MQFANRLYATLWYYTAFEAKTSRIYKVYGKLALFFGPVFVAFLVDLPESLTVYVNKIHKKEKFKF